MKKLIVLMLSMNMLFGAVVELVSGVGVSDTVLEGEMKAYKISGTAGQSVESIMSELTDDADLYVKIGAEPTTTTFDCRSIHTATRDEDCTVDLVNDGDVYIGVYGYKATDFNIKATAGAINNDVVTLTSGVSLNAEVAQGKTNYYKLSASNGETVEGLLSNLSADSDIYVKIGSKPTSSSYDCKSTNGGTTEDKCSVLLVGDAEVFIGVYGYRATTYSITGTKSMVADNVIELTSDIAVTGSVEQGATNYYKIAGQSGETVSSLIDNLSADSDIYVKVGSKPTGASFDCKSTNGGTSSDGCSIVLDADAEVFIGVFGYRATSYQVTATLKSANDEGILLTSNEAQSGSVVRDGMDYYRIPALFADSVMVTLEGLNADADLYVKIGAKPTTADHDCKSTNGGTSNELCTLTILDDTDVYIGVFGFRSTDYTVKAIIDRAVAPANPTVLEDAEDGTLNPNWVTARGGQDPFICTSNGKTMMANHANGQGDALYRYELAVDNTTQKVLSVDIGGGSTCNIGYGTGYMPHYSVGVIVETKLGLRSMEWNSWYTHQGYEPRRDDNGHNVFLKYPSSAEMVRGWYAPITTWTHLEVNLDTELKRLEPDNRIYKIVQFFATGGFLDNITLSSAQ
jgi:hypothetical protein